MTIPQCIIATASISATSLCTVHDTHIVWKSHLVPLPPSTSSTDTLPPLSRSCILCLPSSTSSETEHRPSLFHRTLPNLMIVTCRIIHYHFTCLALLIVNEHTQVTRTKQILLNLLMPGETPSMKPLQYHLVFLRSCLGSDTRSQ